MPRWPPEPGPRSGRAKLSRSMRCSFMALGGLFAAQAVSFPKCTQTAKISIVNRRRRSRHKRGDQHWAAECSLGKMVINARGNMLSR